MSVTIIINLHCDCCGRAETYSEDPESDGIIGLAEELKRAKSHQRCFTLGKHTYDHLCWVCYHSLKKAHYKQKSTEPSKGSEAKCF